MRRLRSAEHSIEPGAIAETRRFIATRTIIKTWAKMTGKKITLKMALSECYSL
jgi:hypothetical protein